MKLNILDLPLVNYNKEHLSQEFWKDIHERKHGQEMSCNPGYDTEPIHVRNNTHGNIFMSEKYFENQLHVIVYI